MATAPVDVSLISESSPATGADGGVAEELLRRLQQVLLDRSRNALFATLDVAPDVSPRQALRAMEIRYGATATQYGRRLHDLLSGSPAWTLFERPRLRKGDLPPIQELARCEPLLRLMRESGELAERERLLRERDASLFALGRDPTLSEGERQLRERDVHDRYFAEVARIADAYRPYYQSLRRAVSAIPPLIGPRVRSRPMLQPPLISHLFAACHVDHQTEFVARPTDAGGGWVYRQGRHAVTVLDRQSLDLLDEAAWDVAVAAVCAFFVRTGERDPEAAFPLLIDDYFDWRAVDPRKRTLDARREIDARIRLLSSDRIQLHTETDLWLTDPAAGRRRKTAVVSDGPLLIRRSGLYRPSVWQSEAENEPLYGHMVSLGDWARIFIQERAMIGVAPKQLSEYDLRRRQWERRIGWYLTFQMQNQGSKMTFQDVVVDEGEAPIRVTPQHSLRLKTVLNNSQAPWQEMARTNPGKVIRQWTDTLETLHRDGIIGDYSCLDGAVDGSDLPNRSRLATMLERRYQFLPGSEMVKHLRLKAARRAQAKGGAGGVSARPL